MQPKPNDRMERDKRDRIIERKKRRLFKQDMKQIQSLEDAESLLKGKGGELKHGGKRISTRSRDSRDS